MTNRKHKNIGLEKSSGNIFADLGISRPEEYLAKADLANKINCLIKERNLTQIGAAKLLGIDQPKISALVCGRLSGFSIERLFRLLTILNQDIVITIKPHVVKQKKLIPQVRVHDEASQSIVISVKNPAHPSKASPRIACKGK